MIRRVVVGGVVVGLAFWAWVFSPLWLLAALVLSPLVPGRWRLPRIAWIALLYLTTNALLLVVMAAFWVASGFGRRLATSYWQGIHYDLIQGTLWVFFAAARRVLTLTIATVGPTPDECAGRPLIVASRHAGPGDSFTLVHELMHSYDREPRIVLKDTLAWDPAIGTLLNRLPARFISPNPNPGEQLDDQIAALAHGLDANDAFVIFPEGGNFTPARRDRAIARLRKLGLESMAVRAEQMMHVLAPRPGGLLVALDAAPTADVALVAHTGLDHVLTLAEVWRELPMDKRIIMRWWAVPRSEVPDSREERIEWLFAWWERIDEWIEENREPR